MRYIISLYLVGDFSCFDILPLARDEKMPPMLKTVKIINRILILVSKLGIYVLEVIVRSRMIMEVTKATMVMLKDWPVNLIVPRIEDATP